MVELFLNLNADIALFSVRVDGNFYFQDAFYIKFFKEHKYVWIRQEVLVLLRVHTL